MTEVFVEVPFDRIVNVHFKDKRPVSGTVQFTPNSGYPSVKGWTNGAFAFIVTSPPSGAMSYDHASGFIHTAAGAVTGSMDVVLYSAGPTGIPGAPAGSGSVQYGLRNSHGVWLYQSPVIHVDAGGASGGGGAISFTADGNQIEVMFQVLSADGDSSGTLGFGSATGGDSPGFMLTLHG